MKQLLFLLLLTTGGLFAGAQNNREKEPYLTKSLTNDGIKEVKVETSGGGIAVAGVGSSSDYRIEVYVGANNGKKDLSKEEIQKRLEVDYTVTINTTNGRLTAIARPKKRQMDWKRGLSISFNVYVPRNVSTDLVTSGGGIDLRNISGNHDFKTSGGGLSLDRVGGRTNGRTSGGGIHLVNCTDELDLATSGGGIHASACSGNLKLTTSGGSLDLSNLKGTIRATTSGGSIHGSTIEGELTTHTSGGNIALKDLACSLEASTSGGGMQVAVRKPGKYITLSNSGGDIDLQLPGNTGFDLKLAGGKIKTETLNNFSGRIEEDEVAGKVNGGGIPVTARTGGRISLTLR